MRQAAAAVRVPWPAVARLARLELRFRWRAIVGLGLATALMAGAALAIATIAWRTDTAYPRLVSRTGLEDVQISLYQQFRRPSQRPAVVAEVHRDLAALRSRPDVDGSAELAAYVGRMSGPGVSYVSVTAPVRPSAGIGAPVVVRGRAPAPGAPAEVMIEESRARVFGAHVGDRIPLDLLTNAQFLQFSTGIGHPAGGHVVLRIVGVFRYPQPGSTYGSLVGTPAFVRAHPAAAVGAVLLLRTRGHVGAAGFEPRIARMNKELTGRFGAGQMPYVAATAPRSTPDPGLGPTRTVLRTGLLALLAVVVAAGLVLAFQVAGRWSEQGRESQQIEAVLGLRARERVLARLIAGLPAVVLAGAGAVAGALLGAIAEPLGSLARYEPDPGWLPRPTIAALGAVTAVAVAGLAIGAATLSAARLGRPVSGIRRHRHPRPRGRRTLLAVALGAGRGGPSTAMPARSVVAALAALIGVLVVVADLHRQLSGLTAEPARWGWTADFIVDDDTPAVDARLVADTRARDVERVTSTALPMRHGSVSASLTTYGRTTLRGHLPWTVAAGRIPQRAGEVALGPRAAHDLGAGVGSHVTVDGRAGRAVSLRVVGIVVVMTGNREPLGRNALVTGAQLTRLVPAAPYSAAYVRATGAGAAHSLEASLRRTLELETPIPPETVAALDELGRPTRILIAALLLSVLLTIVQGIRLLLRRRRSQLAIVHTLGLSSAELVGSTVAAVVLSTTVAGAFGLPLGWAVSRLVCNEVGPQLGLALHTPDIGPVLLTGAAATLVALIASSAAAVVAAARLRVDLRDA